MVYVELIWDQGRWVINKVGQTTNFRERRKAESYQNSHLKSVIRLDEVPVPVATALREEYTKMVQWIVNPKNEVEPPVRRLFSALIDSGADELGPARNVIAQLLESAVAYDLGEKGHRHLAVLNEFACYPLLLRNAIISSNKDAPNEMPSLPVMKGMCPLSQQCLTLSNSGVITASTWNFQLACEIK